MGNIIEFPKLGVELKVNETAFPIGKFEVNWYGLIIAFGFMLGMILALRACEKYEISKDNFLDYLLYSMPLAIIGARIFYVVFAWDEYKDDWKSIFNIREGGLAIYGGVIFAFLTVLVISRIKKESTIKILDFVAPYIILGQAIGRWGNFTNQEAFGGPTNLPWGMTGNIIKMRLKNTYGLSDQLLVHPTFLYESLLCFIAFGLMLFYRSRKPRQKGEILSLYMVSYGLIRTMNESLRLDSLMLGQIKISRLISIVIFVLGLALFIDLKRRVKIKLAKDEEETESSLKNVVVALSDEDDKSILEEASQLEMSQQDEISAYDVGDSI